MAWRRSRRLCHGTLIDSEKLNRSVLAHAAVGILQVSNASPLRTPRYVRRAWRAAVRLLPFCTESRHPLPASLRRDGLAPIAAGPGRRAVLKSRRHVGEALRLPWADSGPSGPTQRRVGHRKLSRRDGAGHSGRPALRKPSMKRTRSSTAGAAALPGQHCQASTRDDLTQAGHRPRASTIRSARALGIAATRSAVAESVARGGPWSPRNRLVVTTGKGTRVGHASGSKVVSDQAGLA